MPFGPRIQRHVSSVLAPRTQRRHSGSVSDGADAESAEPLTVSQKVALLEKVNLPSLGLLGYTLIASKVVEAGFTEIKSWLRWAGGLGFASVSNKWPLSISSYIDQYISSV